ncbi:NADH-cytochrome b5 reductase [Tulasnella sp. JGI-2019a]|nr:NADH-cytochrome b5 reductase [Tulasnella sp. JGI-2019a]
MSMLARRAGMNIRRFATAPPSGKAQSSTQPLVLIGLAGAMGAAFAYQFVLRTPEGAPVAAKAKPTISALDKDKFIDFKLKKVEPYNHNTDKFTFALPEDTATLLPVASCVLIKTAPENEDPNHPPLLDAKGKPYIRPYTPISPSGQPGEVTFLIKKYETGKVTPYLFDMQPGQTIGIKGPLLKIPYKENELEHIGMIAGGSGITPMYQIIQHALSLPNDKTKITLIFSNVSEKDILVKETLDKWAKDHKDRFKIVYTLDKGDENWKGDTGFITKDMIQKYLAPPTSDNKVKVFVCGPPGQVASVSGPKDGMKQGELKGVLKELGYTSEQVFKF